MPKPLESHIYSQIQKKLEKSESFLRDLFQRGLKAVDADCGFLGFEDLE